MMNQENLYIANEAVQRAAMTPQERERQRLQQERLELLEQLRITPGMDLPPMEFLFRIFDKPCFPRGEVVAVAGKAKSGKTFFTSMLMAACACDAVLDVSREPGRQPLRCLWYDTEQSRQSTLEILTGRIAPLTGSGRPFPQEQYDVFNVRSLPWQERMPLLETAVAAFRPDLVVVDGVRDLISDINDGVRASDVVDRLMKMAQTVDCCVVCVLHQNKGADDRNLRGCIGTELTNKAFEVYSCEKLMPQRIFSVEQALTRKVELGRQLFFEVDELGLPHASQGLQPADEPAAPAVKTYPPLNDKYVYWEDGEMQVSLRDLFCDVLQAYGQLRYTDLQRLVMARLNCKDSGFWNHLFVKAKAEGIIVNGQNSQGRSVWMLPST